MKECLLILCLSLALGTHGEKPKARNNPRDVTFWDFKEKALHFAFPGDATISEYKKTTSCSGYWRRCILADSTLVDWGLAIPDGVEGVPCDEGDECYDYGAAKVVVTVNGNCQKGNWTTTELTELNDCINLLVH